MLILYYNFSLVAESAIADCSIMEYNSSIIAVLLSGHKQRKIWTNRISIFLGIWRYRFI